MRGPHLSRFSCGWGNALDRAFWNVALNRRKAKEMVAPDLIGQRVDERCDIYLRLNGQRGVCLSRRQRFGDRGKGAHALDAKARINGFYFITEQPGREPVAPR